MFGDAIRILCWRETLGLPNLLRLLSMHDDNCVHFSSLHCTTVFLLLLIFVVDSIFHQWTDFMPRREKNGLAVIKISTSHHENLDHS